MPALLAQSWPQSRHLVQNLYSKEVRAPPLCNGSNVVRKARKPSHTFVFSFVLTRVRCLRIITRFGISPQTPPPGCGFWGRILRQSSTKRLASSFGDVQRVPLHRSRHPDKAPDNNRAGYPNNCLDVTGTNRGHIASTLTISCTLFACCSTGVVLVGSFLVSLPKGAVFLDMVVRARSTTLFRCFHRCIPRRLPARAPDYLSGVGDLSQVLFFPSEAVTDDHAVYVAKLGVRFLLFIWRCPFQPLGEYSGLCGASLSIIYSVVFLVSQVLRVLYLQIYGRGSSTIPHHPYY